MGVDIQEVIRGSNSQPFSQIHQPGIGVGGHCIPVYPHFLISRAPELEIPALARRVNDAQVGLAVQALQRELGSIEGAKVLVLGLTYREDVKELAYTRAIPLMERLGFHGAEVWAWDPLLSDEEVARTGARPWRWGEPAPFRAIVVQTGARRFRDLDFGWFPELAVLYDGRNSMRGVALPDGVRYLGVGVPDPRRQGRPGRHAAPAGGGGRR
jgi:nucleotide sugar dehydrogenase